MADSEADRAVRFESHRKQCFAAAHRMLGSVVDAEDTVQETWLRWSKRNHSEVVHPGAYLVRITTRLALNRLRTLRTRREAYVGPWLPEPLVTGPTEPDAAEQARLRAVATTSETVARGLGFDDGENAPVDEMLTVAERMCAAVTVPVTVDVESGYGLTVADLVTRLVEIGAAGFNIEDSEHTAGSLADTAQQAGRVAALRKSADETGVPLVINARVDTFLHGAPGTTEATIVDEALERGREYLAAGADCVYPLLAGVEQVSDKMVDELGTVNILAGPNAPDLNRLAELGVARVSLGPGVGRRYETWPREEMTALASTDAGT